MGWQYKPAISQGEYIALVATSGTVLDLFSSVTVPEILQRINANANGWHAVTATYKRGIFSGTELKIYGIADSLVFADNVKAEADSAVNSFWTISGVSFSVLAGGSPSDPLPGTADVADWVKWVAIAASAIAIAIVVIQLRKATE